MRKTSFATRSQGDRGALLGGVARWGASLGAALVLSLGASAPPVAAADAGGPGAAAAPGAPVPSVTPPAGALAPAAFQPLPLGAVKPTGWLRRQLQIQAAGLTGHLDEIWPDLGPRSGWRGGDGESWERGPYFLDGLVPLAHLLDDRRLIKKARAWVEWTLANQRPDGNIGPEKNKDFWPNMVMLKVLIQHHEATGDARVPPLLRRYFAYHLSVVEERPLREWARFRWPEEVVSILWLAERAPDPALLELARRLRAQGFDWRGHFERFDWKGKTSKAALGLKPDMSNTTELSMRAHGVNNAMALKAFPLWYRVTGDPGERDALGRALEVLERFHGQPNGMWSGDEHYAGRSPTQGVELCAVVETMYSLEIGLATLGTAALGDRLEKIAYNALPATFSKDMWSHQYDQQPNQVLCDIRKRAWSSNGDESNVFGLEPNFGCCTANMHQGWAKLAASTWMATPDGGLAAVVLAPTRVSARVRGGVPVTVEEKTDYPFRGELRFTVRPARPAEFPLLVRVPAWAAGARVAVAGAAAEEARPGAFHRIERRWRPGDVVVVTLPQALRSSPWPEGGIVLERGPLVLALQVGEAWKKIERGMGRPAKPPAADWEVTPTTPWNLALLLDPARPAEHLELVEAPIGRFPWSAEGAPVRLRGRGRRVPGWTLVEGSAGPVPASPVDGGGAPEPVTLVPYGAAKLRVTVLPWARP